jgi:ABC-type transport system involved in multi-copper enzyme maturation permease subunit
MQTSPIVHVELMTVGRRRRYFVVRAVYGLLMLLAMWVCYESTLSQYSASLRSAAQFASTFFGTFSVIQLAAVMFLTPPMIAGTIASEHERRTIDYLLTTQLGDAEIALGKFAARMWAVFTQLITGLPILAIAMSMGGIAPKQLFESFLIGLLTLLSVGSISIAVSSRTARARDAVTRSYVIALGAMLMPALLMWIFMYLQFESRGTWLEPVFRTLTEATWFLTALNPFVFMFVGVLQPFVTAPLTLPVFATIHGGAAILLCWWAVWSVRRFYVRNQGRGTPVQTPPAVPTRAPAVASQLTAVPALPAGKGTGPVLALDTAMLATLPDTEASDPAISDAADSDDAMPDETPTSESPAVDYRGNAVGGGVVRWRSLLDADKPMWWKERLSQKTLGRLGWGARIVTVLFFGAAWFLLFVTVLYSLKYAFSNRDWWESPIMYFAFLGAPTIACIAMLLTAVRAAGAITAEREQDTWISLISTPLDGSEIVRAKMVGAAFSVRYWYLLIAAAWFFCALLHPTYIIVIPVLAFVYALGLWFAAVVGVYFSLRSATSLKAMGSTLAILVLGAGFGPLILAILVQRPEPTAFSLPVVIGMPQAAAMAFSSEYSRVDSEFGGYVVLVFFATVGYFLATLGLHSNCIRQFDALAGRSATISRSRVEVGGDQDASAAEGSG